MASVDGLKEEKLEVSGPPTFFFPWSTSCLWVTLRMWLLVDVAGTLSVTVLQREEDVGHTHLEEEEEEEDRTGTQLCWHKSFCAASRCVWVFEFQLWARTSGIAWWPLLDMISSLFLIGVTAKPFLCQKHHILSAIPAGWHERICAVERSVILSIDFLPFSLNHPTFPGQWLLSPQYRSETPKPQTTPSTHCGNWAMRTFKLGYR